jgi:hypothetical protein
VAGQAPGKVLARGWTPHSEKVILDLHIERAGAVSRLVIASEASILGKLGTLGHSIIQHKADGIMTQFAQAIRQALEADGEAGAPKV